MKSILNYVIVMITVSCNAQYPIDSAENFYQWDFESVIPLHNLLIEDESPIKNSVSIVADPLNPDNKVLKTVLLKGNDRTEVSLYSADLKNILYFYSDAAKGFKDKSSSVPDNYSLGNEVWISMKVLKIQEQNSNGIKPCIMQLGPVSNITLNPPVSSSGFCQLRMRNGLTPNDNKWNWRIFGGRIFTPVALDIDNNFVKSTNDKWEKFIIHCKYTKSMDGIIEVWKDGVKYINIVGANAIENNRFRIKWGLYLGIGNHVDDDLTCYFDDVKIAGSNSSFDLINK
jgi:hypothetical protein